MSLQARHQPDLLGDDRRLQHSGFCSPGYENPVTRPRLRWILAALHKGTSFSLAELSQAIRGLLDRLNNRPFKKLPSSRRSMYESLDKPALKPLLATVYQYAQWNKAEVHIDYHV
ncbi:hypothetical protein DFAR_400032 [Desulfarculales bacterium]